MCLRTKGIPESTTIFSVEAAGQVYNQTNRFVYLGGGHQPQRRPVHRGRAAHTQRIVQLREVHPRTVQLTECFPQARNPNAKIQRTRDIALRLRNVEPTRVPLRHAAPSPSQLPDSLHRLAKEQSHRPPYFLSRHPTEDGK